MLIFRGVAVMFLILTAVPPVVQFSHPVWTSPKLRMLRGFVILCRCDGHILKTWSKPPWKRSPGMSKQTANFRPFSWSLLRVMEVDFWFRMDFLAKATCEHLIQGMVDGISILKPLWSHIINISSRWSDAYNLSGKKYEKLFEGLGNCTKNSGEASKRYGGRTYTHPFFARIRWFHQPFFGYFFFVHIFQYCLLTTFTFCVVEARIWSTEFVNILKRKVKKSWFSLDHVRHLGWSKSTFRTPWIIETS